MLACLAASVVVMASVGLWSLTISTRAADTLYHDKLRTVEASTAVSDGMRNAYEEAVRALTTQDSAQRASTTARLLNATIPTVDVQIATLRNLSTIDTARETQEVASIAAAWSALRSSIVPAGATPAAGRAALLAQIEIRALPISSATTTLGVQEQRESATAARRAHNAWRLGVVLILSAAGAALVIGVIVMLYGARRLVGRAVAEETTQQEFVRAMQLARNEDDAYNVLSRHIRQILVHAHVVVFNRNNSADRLEAMTPLPSRWPLAANLEAATPDSCAAVRSARAYRRSPNQQTLVVCEICDDCPSHSLCTPITVSGEIIGSVLVDRDHRLEAHDGARVEQTIVQAAPVLANLRNLAIAEFRAATDALTGLPNKRAVSHTLKRMVAQASRTLSPLALLSLDLDHFKQINDRYGHPVGDEVLAAVGAALQDAIRESDFVGRNGGEEFLILLPATDRAGAQAIAERVAQAVHKTYVPDVEGRITASIGIAVLPDDAGDADKLERAADRALYSAKTNGRDRIEVANALAPSRMTAPATTNE